MMVASCGECLESWAINDVEGVEQPVEEVRRHAHERNHRLDIKTESAAKITPRKHECACGRRFIDLDVFAEHVQAVHALSPKEML